jgi:hypothetical protein
MLCQVRCPSSSAPDGFLVVNSELHNQWMRQLLSIQSRCLKIQDIRNHHIDALRSETTRQCTPVQDTKPLLLAPFRSCPRRRVTSDHQMSNVIDINKGASPTSRGQQATDGRLTYCGRASHHENTHVPIIYHKTAQAKSTKSNVCQWGPQLSY